MIDAQRPPGAKPDAMQVQVTIICDPFGKPLPVQPMTSQGGVHFQPTWITVMSYGPAERRVIVTGCRIRNDGTVGVIGASAVYYDEAPPPDSHRAGFDELPGDVRALVNEHAPAHATKETPRP